MMSIFSRHQSMDWHVTVKGDLESLHQGVAESASRSAPQSAEASLNHPIPQSRPKVAEARFAHETSSGAAHMHTQALR